MSFVGSMGLVASIAFIALNDGFESGVGVTVVVEVDLDVDMEWGFDMLRDGRISFEPFGA